MRMKITESVPGETQTRLPGAWQDVWEELGAEGVWGEATPCMRTALPPPSVMSPSTWMRVASPPRHSPARPLRHCPAPPPAPTQNTGEQEAGWEMVRGGGRTAGRQKEAASEAGGAAPPAQSVEESTEAGRAEEGEVEDTSLC